MAEKRVAWAMVALLSGILGCGRSEEEESLEDTATVDQNDAQELLTQLPLDDRIHAEITRRISSSPSGDYLSMLSNYSPIRYIAPGDPPHTGEWNAPVGGFVWNTACWANGLDFTGIGSFRADHAGGRWYVGTLLSPRHFITAKHVAYGLRGSSRDVFEDKVHFILADGTEHEAVIQDDSGRVGADLCIFYFTTDVPSTVSYYRILPADYDNYLTYNPDDTVGFELMDDPDGLYGKPVVYLTGNDERKVCIGRVRRAIDQTLVVPPANESYGADYYETLQTGDSGAPTFLLVKGQLLFLGVHRSAIGYTDEFACSAVQQAAINAAMADLDVDGTGYQLTEGEL
jgi:hypothetical protein